jgi:hypothetical protein
MKNQGHIKNLTDKRFGRLIATKFIKIGVRGLAIWKCQCDCGNVCEVLGYSLTSGNTKSCGCSHISLDAPFNRILHRYKKSAREKNLLFNLTVEQFKLLLSNNCYYCGQKPSSKMISDGNIELLYNGIDRVNNILGYTPENCVSCCKTCNYMKRGLSVADFIEQCAVIASYCKKYAPEA